MDIQRKRNERKRNATAPRYDSQTTLETGVIARESFVSVGSHGIDGETRRLLIHIN